MARGWKLMDDQKAAIEAVHDTGVPYTALAVQYGVSVATILRVCRQDTYERQKAAIGGIRRLILRKSLRPGR